MELDFELQTLSENPNHPCDLAELALLLARDEYPDLDVEAYLDELALMGREAERFVRGTLTSSVQGLCRYLFHEMGFRGNDRDYYDARNSYLNQVLDRRKGLPLTLSLVAMAVGNRAGLEVAGVGLPGHFVAKAVRGSEEVLFDPYHGGRLLSPEQCEQLVERVSGVSFEASEESLAAVSPAQFIRRLLINLKAAYFGEGDFRRAVPVIERLRQLSPDDLHEQRDLGISLLHAGRAGRAIDHLSAFLDAFPDGVDADTLRELLDQAKETVARWN